MGAKWQIDLHARLKHNSRMHFDSLSLLKVESTVCFQRKRSTLTSCALKPYTVDMFPQTAKLRSKTTPSQPKAAAY
ncbi:hypothetical protein HMPREF3216_00172 [Gardnerella vaginalis]|uniref:Uncharacterized protein n=1 Tax=Gardnerella vaginalis TaxID=2702 RepID=A0A133NSF7_GARVA|nr:hypothetical protein HMPREF3216_00172 [Gardnerella vaginalis]